MEIRHLKLVQAVAATKNLTKAAEMLFVSQSALSHQLSALEEECQTQLFVRTKKQMLLTPAGERLLKTANQVLCELEKATRDIQRMNQEDAGTLRITTGCYTCYHWLSPVLKKYRKAYPNVSLEIIPEGTYQSFEYLLDGKVDLVLISDIISNPNLEFNPIFEDELIAVVSPDHHLKDRKFITPNDFEENPLIMYNVPDENSSILNEFFKPANQWPSEILRMQLTEAVIEMVKADMGIGILAEWSVQPYIERGELIAIPLNKKIRRTWYVVSLKNWEEPAYMRAFVEGLKKKLAVGVLST